MSPEVASALAQISHTQNALMLQMAALSVVPPQQPPNQITVPTGNQFGMEADTVDRAAAHTMDKPVEHTVDVTVDVDAVVAGVEEVVHLLKRHRITIYLRSEVRLPHSLVEELDHSMPQTLLNVSIIGILFLMWL